MGHLGWGGRGQPGVDSVFGMRPATTLTLGLLLAVILLAGIIYVAWFHFNQTGQWDFEIVVLIESAKPKRLAEQGWVLEAFLAGFAIKTPL